MHVREWGPSPLFPHPPFPFFLNVFSAGVMALSWYCLGVSSMPSGCYSGGRPSGWPWQTCGAGLCMQAWEWGPNRFFPHLPFPFFLDGVILPGASGRVDSAIRVLFRRQAKWMTVANRRMSGPTHRKFGPSGPYAIRLPQWQVAKGSTERRPTALRFGQRFQGDNSQSTYLWKRARDVTICFHNISQSHPDDNCRQRLASPSISC